MMMRELQINVPGFSSKFAKSNLSIPYLNLQQFRQAAQLTVHLMYQRLEF